MKAFYAHARRQAVRRVLQGARRGAEIVGFNRLYQALAERQVDGQENPLVIAEENKLYEVCRYLSLTNHQWAGSNMLANHAYWQRLPPTSRTSWFATPRPMSRSSAPSCAPPMRAWKDAARSGMIVNTVDVDSFRKRLIGANFYRDWRQSAGEKAWALMEAEVGKSVDGGAAAAGR